MPSSSARIEHVTGLTEVELDTVVRALRARTQTKRRRGRPWARCLRERVQVICMSLRTNLTLREIAGICGMSKSQVHRIIAHLTPRLAALLPHVVHDHDRRQTWIVDGTLVPTRDHSSAAKSKNYRWSCNAQVLIRGADLRVVAVVAGGPGNRNDTVHYRGSRLQAICQFHRRVLADGGYRGVPELQTPVFRKNRIVRDAKWRRHRKRRARVEHAIARLKDWRVLRDHRRRGRHLNDAFNAVAFLHNLRIQLRDNS